MSRQGLEVWDAECLRPHYARTLWHWVDRLEAQRDEARRLVGEKRLRTWLIYMAGSAHAFARGWISIYQLLGVKADGGRYRALPADPRAPVPRVSMRWLIVVAAAWVLVWTAGCSGVGGGGEAPKVKYRGDSGPNKVPDEGPWKEAEVALPPYPRDQDLIRFELTGQTTNRFYVDGSSLSVEPDKVIRFALVIRPSGETSTVSYAGVQLQDWRVEGLRLRARRPALGPRQGSAMAPYREPAHQQLPVHAGGALLLHQRPVLRRPGGQPQEPSYAI